MRSSVIVTGTSRRAALVRARLEAILAAPLRASTSFIVVDDGLRNETVRAFAALGSQITIVERNETAGFADAYSLIHRARGR
jgi:hypothetical protein